MLTRTNKIIDVHPSYRGNIKTRWRKPGSGAETLQNSPPISPSMLGIILTTAYIDFPCVPLFNLVQYFSNLTVQNNHCPAYRQQILFSVLHSQFQDISRVFSGSLHELDQVEPGAHMPARG